MKTSNRNISHTLSTDLDSCFNSKRNNLKQPSHLSTNPNLQRKTIQCNKGQLLI